MIRNTILGELDEEAVIVVKVLNVFKRIIKSKKRLTISNLPEILKKNPLKTKFVDKGIPVILGEYGAYRRNERSSFLWI